MRTHITDSIFITTFLKRLSIYWESGIGAFGTATEYHFVGVVWNLTILLCHGTDAASRKGLK